MNVICKKCGSTDLTKRWTRNSKEGWLCNNCGAFQSIIDKRVKLEQVEIDLAQIAYLLCKSSRNAAEILSKLYNDKKYSWKNIHRLVKNANLIIKTGNARVNHFENKKIEILDLKTNEENNKIPSGIGLFITPEKSILLKIKKK